MALRNRQPMLEPHNYFIKKGYNINENPKEQEDSSGRASIFQVEVYKLARDLIVKHKLQSVLDVGCGHGTKLGKFISPICSDIIGIDRKNSIEFCKGKYSFGAWYEDDIENPHLVLARKYDIIICADVIEHISDPDKLLDYMKQFSHDQTFIILSTPDRDILRGADSFGPPENSAHIREWNRREFHKYVESHGFEILEHRNARARALNISDTVRLLAGAKVFLAFNEIVALARASCQLVACKLNRSKSS